MSAEPLQVRLVLDLDDGDLEQAEEDLQYLMGELTQLDGASMVRESAGPAPAGTRGGGVEAAAALLIALGSSGATLPVLIGLARDWLGRRGGGTIRLKIGADEVEVTNVPTDMQRRALEEFQRRHEM